MNFNYSYRAFLITTLLFGILFLTLWSIRLSSEIVEEQEVVPITYEEDWPNEETLEAAVPKTRITTNQAYNEAENFIKKAETERSETPKTIEEQTSKNNTKPTVTDAATQEALLEAQNRLDALKKNALANASEAKNNTTKGVNKKTTIKYSLKNRQPLSLPNPVYTCEGGGTIVITIEVNALGKIVSKKYNKQASTNTNGCLIESALVYAENARFTTKAGTAIQIGTITYLFPGQE